MFLIPSRLEELKTAKEDLKTKIACEKLAKPKISVDLVHYVRCFRKLDTLMQTHRKMLIDTFINAI